MAFFCCGQCYFDAILIVIPGARPHNLLLSPELLHFSYHTKSLSCPAVVAVVWYSLYNMVQYLESFIRDNEERMGLALASQLEQIR